MTNTETITTTKTNPYYFKVLALLAALAVTASLLVTSAAKPAHATITFTVNSTGDEDDQHLIDEHCDVDLTTPGDQCTLRAALHETHFSSELHEIDFNIPGSGVHTIKPSSALPDIGPNTQVIINGYTQGDATSDPADDATENTLTEPGKTNAVLKIELDGSNLGFDDDGLRISDFSRGSVIKGLVIRNFSNNGIHLSGQANRVEGNFIGTDASGTTAKPNTQEGVLVKHFFAGQKATNNTVGGDTPAARNVISGNFGSGVQVEDDANSVVGNLIGTAKDGTGFLGNSFDGVEVVGGASDNDVGGTTPKQANTIAFNTFNGVSVSGNGVHNRVLSNSIFSNGSLGIDLNRDGVTANDTGDVDDANDGPNLLQNFPVISSAKTGRKGTNIAGKLNSDPNKTFTVQFFASPEADASGNGEGKTLIGEKAIATDGSGNATFTFKPTQKVTKGQFITATATDLEGNTSEFSNAKKVVRKR